MWSYLVNDVEQSVPSRIGEYEVDQVWLQTVAKHVHWYGSGCGRTGKVVAVDEEGEGTGTS